LKPVCSIILAVVTAVNESGDVLSADLVIENSPLKLSLLDEARRNQSIRVNHVLSEPRKAGVYVDLQGTTLNVGSRNREVSLSF